MISGRIDEFVVEWGGGGGRRRCGVLVLCLHVQVEASRSEAWSVRY